MDWLNKLNYFKKLSGKTLEEISEDSGVPRGTLNKLFAGQTKDPQLGTIRAVVRSLGCSLDDLVPESIPKLNAPASISREAQAVAEAYDKADRGIQISVRKLLDIDDKSPMPRDGAAG